MRGFLPGLLRRFVGFRIRVSAMAACGTHVRPPWARESAGLAAAGVRQRGLPIAPGFVRYKSHQRLRAIAHAQGSGTSPAGAGRARDTHTQQSGAAHVGPPLGPAHRSPCKDGWPGHGGSGTTGLSGRRAAPLSYRARGGAPPAAPRRRRSEQRRRGRVSAGRARALVPAPCSEPIAGIQHVIVTPLSTQPLANPPCLPLQAASTSCRPCGESCAAAGRSRAWPLLPGRQRYTCLHRFLLALPSQE